MDGSSYIRIEGTREQLLGVTNVVDLRIRPCTAQERTDGTVEVCGYATEAAMTEIRSRGLTVEVHRDREGDESPRGTRGEVGEDDGRSMA